MRLVPQSQTSIYESTIEHPALEDALEKREQHRARTAAARKEYREVDELVKAIAGELDLGDDAPVRVGRFVLTRRAAAARHVSFETDASTRLTIRLLKDAP